MALTGRTGICSWCHQPDPGNLVQGCTPIPCPTCTDQCQVYHKAEPPSGGGEWQCDTCQSVFPGGTTHYRQDSKLLCECCRTKSEYEFAETSYMHHQAPTLFYGGRRGRSRPAVSPLDVRKKQPMLPKVHRPSGEFRGTRYKHHTLRRFSKHIIDSCSKFCYEKKGCGEPCVLRVSQQDTAELLWGHNGTVIHCGRENCLEFDAGDQTAGIYLCSGKTTDELILVHVICMEEKEGSRPQPLGKGQLCLAPDLDSLSDAFSDNDPVLCYECTRRGTIFLDAGKITVLSPVFGEMVTLRAPVCGQEMNKFHFMWQHDSVNVPSQNRLSFTFQALKPSYCMCIAVNPSSGQETYSSVVFKVHPTGTLASTSVPVTDSTVRHEVSPSLSQGVHDHPSALLSNTTSSSRSSQLRSRGLGATLAPFGELEEGHISTANPASFVISPVFQLNHPAAQPASVCRPPQSEPDSEPEPRPAESYEVERFLMKELVESGAFREPAFNLSSLADSPTCNQYIRDLIYMVKQSLPNVSEQRTVEQVVRRICQETTLDATVGIRRCVALMYKLVWSLRDDEQNAYHQSLGTRLMLEAPFPPMLQKWTQGTSLSLPRGESVILSVTACNADRYDWLFNREPINRHGGPSCRISVSPSSCGVYQCSVRNKHGCVQTPPTHIIMNDERTSSSLTEATLETSYNVDITPGPSTSIACTDVTPVEAETPAIHGRHGVMVVGTMPPSRTVMEQVVPGVLSSDDSRGLILHPTSHLQSAPPQCVPRGLFGPPSPHIHSTTFRPPGSRPP